MKFAVQWLLVLFLLTFIGQIAHAQELSIREKIIMPGPLSSAHAEFESDCKSCHTSFKKEAMTALCLDCHKDIATDLMSMTGFHGKSLPVLTSGCETCHKDHEGRDADIVGLLHDRFNHAQTNFTLEGAHQNVACSSCHAESQKYRDADTSCISCHKEKDIHSGAVGDNCASCHQPHKWHDLLVFDHSKTEFSLVGKHRDVSCTGCHINQKFKFSDQSCVGCHKTADVHGGSNGSECQNCHSPHSWSQMDFDHSKTEFPLVGKHNDIPCHACHKDNVPRTEAATDCHSCHVNDDVHLGRNGIQCQSCHNSEQWQQIHFDHSVDTNFPLTGNHIGLTCSQCHAGPLDHPVARDCAGCHIADDVHHDPQMAVCGTCHNTLGWDSISEFEHDFTTFPLIGMHQIAPCESCHIGNQFAGTKSACVDCHVGDDIHLGSLGSSCNQCHTPNAWNLWRFDHAQHTGYVLEGKHKELACESCHLPGTQPGSTATQCGTCHRAQDIHDGGFGNQCGRCHNTTNFFELIID